MAILESLVELEYNNKPILPNFALAVIYPLFHGLSSFSAISINATVPGDIYSDLMSAGILKVDPYYRDNDVLYRWVAYDDWTFERSFKGEFDISILFLSSNWKFLDIVSIHF